MHSSIFKIAMNKSIKVTSAEAPTPSPPPCRPPDPLGIQVLEEQMGCPPKLSSNPKITKNCNKGYYNCWNNMKSNDDTFTYCINQLRYIGECKDDEIKNIRRNAICNKKFPRKNKSSICKKKMELPDYGYGLSTDFKRKPGHICDNKNLIKKPDKTGINYESFEDALFDCKANKGHGWEWNCNCIDNKRHGLVIPGPSPNRWNIYTKTKTISSSEDGSIAYTTKTPAPH